MDDKISNVKQFTRAVKCLGYQRVGHQHVRLGQHLYIVGGIAPDGSFATTILKFNLENDQIQPLSAARFPLGEGYSLFTFEQRLFAWGSTLQSDPKQPVLHPSNALYQFDGKEFEFSSQSGDIPSPRSHCCSAMVANRFLLIYGGFSDSQHFKDWYVLDLTTRVWSRVETSTTLPTNTHYKLGWSNGRGFLLSLESVWDTTRVEVKHELFEVRVIDFGRFRISIQKVAVLQDDRMPCRIDPTLVFTDNEMLVMGGSKPMSPHDFLDDCWSFSFEAMAWKQLPVQIPVNYGFTAEKHKNKLYFLAGAQHNQLSNAVSVMSFQRQDLIEDKVCEFCRNVYSLENHSYRNSYNFQESLCMVPSPPSVGTLGVPAGPVAQISTTFVTKLAQQIQNPLHAISILIDNALNMSATTLSIDIVSRSMDEQHYKHNLTYLVLVDNSQPFNCEEILRLIYSFKFRIERTTSDPAYEEEISLRNEYGLNLKLAALRLGRSCLFVTKTSDCEVLICYFSDQYKECPDGEATFNCFSYSLSLNNEKWDPRRHTNQIDQNIIRNNVSHLIEQKEYADISQYSTKLYIFDLYDLDTSKTNGKQDIVFPFGNAHQNSLSDMVIRLYLTPYIGRKILVRANKLKFVNLIEQFKSDCREETIEKVDTSSDDWMFRRCALYRAAPCSKYPLAAVFIYHQNRLITTVVSKDRSLCGYIEIPNQIQVDIFKCRIQKLCDQKKLLQYIQNKEEQRKRQRASMKNQQSHNTVNKRRSVDPL